MAVNCRLVLTMCLLMSGCYGSPVGEDSWQHYVDGGRFITTSPSVSEDLSRMVYATPCTGKGDIYIVQQSGEVTRLSDSDEFESSPMFTPDGQRILFVREQAGLRHIWTMDLDGGNRRPLTQGAYIDDPLHLSRDGRLLIFNRSSASRRSGRVVRAFALRINERPSVAYEVGDAAVPSADSSFVIYSSQGGLRRLDLSEPKVQRSRVFGTGVPVALSADGNRVLVVRSQNAKQWSGDDELWILNLRQQSENRVGIGHGAVFLGPNEDKVLFFSTFEQVPWVSHLDGSPAVCLECSSGNKTYPRVIQGGKAAIFGLFPEHRSSDYSVLRVDGETLRMSTIATLTCSGTSFQISEQGD